MKFQVGPWPRFLHPKRVERDNKVAYKEFIKLAKVRRRVHVRMGEFKNLTHYLSVPNGEDIRMVYNGTSRGLNSSLWAPHFALPTVGSTIWSVKRVMLTAGRDMGEILLKLMLSEEVRFFYGVDITNVSTEEE